MVLIFEKIWNLGGVFYLSLFLGLLLKKSKFSSFIIITAALVIGSYHLLANVPHFINSVNLVTKPLSWKLDNLTYGQYEYAQVLNQKIPRTAIGCIYWTWDIPTLYMVEKLYPRYFNPVSGENDPGTCDYLLSWDKPTAIFSYQPLFTYKDYYVYRRP